MGKESHRVGTNGFSLAELIVSVGVGGIALASILATFLAFATGTRSVGSYVEMSQESRKILELFSRDIRVANDVLAADESEIAIRYPDDDFHEGELVRYVYDDFAGIFSRIERDNGGNLISNEILLNGIREFTFKYFDPLGGELEPDDPSRLLSIKSVQIDSEIIRELSRTDVTDYIISARFMMRNRPVTD